MTVQNWLKLEPGIFTFATRIVYTNSPQYSGKQGQEIQILNTFLIKVRSAESVMCEVIKIHLKRRDER